MEETLSWHKVGNPEILTSNFHFSEKTQLIFNFSNPLWFPVVFIAAVFAINGLLHSSHVTVSNLSITYFISSHTSNG